MQGRISVQDGFAVVDFRGCRTRELFEVYQDFGMLCALEEVHCALLKTGDEDADVHYAVRDILATLARVAIPVHLLLALVATSDSVAKVGGTLRPELSALGCEARVFRAEPEADRWLRGAAAGAPAGRAAGELTAA